MKKTLFILCLCCLAILPLQASIIDTLQSQALAVGFVSNLDGVSTTNITINGTTTITCAADISRPVLYIHNIYERGTSNARFVIVSGDSRARYILAYGDDELDLDNIPEGLQDFIDMYKEQIEAMIENYPDEVAMFTSDGGNDADSTMTVEPLITTMWGQGRPFNNRCPVYDGPVHYIDTVCSTGCGSTALAMIFKYYNFADSYSTIPEYTTESLNIHLDALEPIDFDWNNMLDIYEEGSYTDEQADAVAWLMRYIGQSEKMNYTPGSSACKVRNIEKTLMAFGYSYKKVNKGSCDDRAWAAMIQAELLAGQPVLYLSGQSEDSNHAYIIDGYDADGDRYHINWGWSGNGNAHCALNAFKPSNSPSIYSHHQMMYINVHPAEKAITVDKDTLTLEEYTGYTCVESFTVSGHSGQDIHLEIEDDSLHQFSVDPSVITPTEALNGKTVNVYFNPHFSGAAQATLTLSNDSIVPVDIILNGYGIKSDGDIILDSTYVKITSTVNKQGQANQGRIMRIHFFWQGAEENNQIMIGAPSSDGDRFLDYDPIDVDDLVTESFTTEIIGDSCYEADLIVCSNISDALTTNHGDFSIILFYSFPTLGKHDAILKISHKSLSVKPQYVHLNGMAVWPTDAQYIPGDANGDGIVDVDDVITLIAYVLSNATTINTEAADMNFDGVIDISDITQLIQHILDGNPVIIPTISSSVTSLNFGTVASGNEITKTFTVTGTYLTGNLTLSSSSPYYTVTPTTITADEAASGTTVTVVYNPTEEGTHNATLTISGGDAKSKTVSLSGECIARPTITASPSTWDFGTIVSGWGEQKLFTITGSNLSDGISISPAETDGGEYTISPTWLPADGGTVTVTYSPLDFGDSSTEFTFSSGETSTSITVSGECVPATISPSVTSLDFGAVAVGDEKTMTLRVNGTGGNWTLSSSSSFYTITPTTITPKEAITGKTITVKFKPPVSVSAGAYNATLTISGGGAESKTVSLKGECVYPLILTDVTSLDFTESGSKQFTVSGFNWPDNLTLSITGSGSQYFSLDRTTISKSEADNGATITVYCNAPSNLVSARAQIVIGSGGSYTKTIDLSYNPYPPIISTSTTYLNFGEVLLGNEKTNTFTVTLETTHPGILSNLSNLTLSSSNPCYTISPATISPVEATIGKTVIVTYTPTNVGNDVAAITISGCGAESKTVILSGEGVVPVIRTNYTTLDFTERETKYLKVTGTHLIGDVTLTLTGADSRYFHLNKTSISMDDAAHGATVSVNCSPSVHTQNASAQIIISSPGAETKTVNLNYSQGQSVTIN